MKISNDLPAPELDPKRKAEETGPKTGRVQPSREQPQGESAVHLSERAQELLRLRRETTTVAEARSERVDQIRAAISEGRYLIAADVVADRLLQSLERYPEGI